MLLGQRLATLHLWGEKDREALILSDYFCTLWIGQYIHILRTSLRRTSRSKLPLVTVRESLISKENRLHITRPYRPCRSTDRRMIAPLYEFGAHLATLFTRPRAELGTQIQTELDTDFAEGSIVKTRTKYARRAIKFGCEPSFRGSSKTVRCHVESRSRLKEYKESGCSRLER